MSTQHVDWTHFIYYILNLFTFQLSYHVISLLSFHLQYIFYSYFHVMILLPILLRIIETVKRELCTWCHQYIYPPLKLCARVHCLFSCYYFCYYWWKSAPPFVHRPHLLLGCSRTPTITLSFLHEQFSPSHGIFPFSIKACSYFSLLKQNYWLYFLCSCRPTLPSYKFTSKFLKWIVYTVSYSYAFILVWTHCNQPSIATTPTNCSSQCQWLFWVLILLN